MINKRKRLKNLLSNKNKKKKRSNKLHHNNKKLIMGLYHSILQRSIILAKIKITLVRKS